MSLDLTLWLAMGGAAFFYHYAMNQGTKPALYMMTSVAVSVLVMVIFPHEWLVVLLGQAILYGVLTAYKKYKG